MPSTRDDQNQEHQQDANQHDDDQQSGHQSHGGMKMYWRFGAMILTAMVVMYAVMFIGSWE